MTGFRQGAAICGSVFLLALSLRSGEVAIGFMRQGLALCADTIIPTLFPFMVVSSLLVESGIGEWLGRLLARPMRWLFGVSGSAVCPILLGALCGFPVGAKTAAALYDRGSIDRTELERLLTFCNNTGSAFVISAVGSSLWSSPTFGMGLYAIQLGCACLIGILGRRNGGMQTDICPAVSARSAAEVFCEAVTSAATGMIHVCGYVLFFSAFVGVIGLLTDRVTTSPLADALLCSFFELSSGVRAAAGLGKLFPAAVLTGFTVGWSGLSVHLQIMSITAGRGISYRPYLLAKAAQGLLCAGLTALWLVIAPPTDLAPRTTAAVFCAFPDHYLRVIRLCFFGALLFAAAIRLLQKKKRKFRTFSGNPPRFVV